MSRSPTMQGSVSASADQINWLWDLLYRGRTHHDAAVGASCKQVRPQARPDGGRRRLPWSPPCCVALRSRPLQIVAFSSFCRNSTARRSSAFSLRASPFCSTSIRWKRARVLPMALFGVSVMVGPVLGPVIGGWLSSTTSSWRWVFYIERAPGGWSHSPGYRVLSQGDEDDAAAKLDWLGFGRLDSSLSPPCQSSGPRGANLTGSLPLGIYAQRRQPCAL